MLLLLCSIIVLLLQHIYACPVLVAALASVLYPLVLIATVLYLIIDIFCIVSLYGINCSVLYKPGTVRKKKWILLTKFPPTQHPHTPLPHPTGVTEHSAAVIQKALNSAERQTSVLLFCRFRFWRAPWWRCVTSRFVTEQCSTRAESTRLRTDCGRSLCRVPCSAAWSSAKTSVITREATPSFDVMHTGLGWLQSLW